MECHIALPIRDALPYRICLAIKKMQNAFTFVEAVYDNGEEMSYLYNEMKVCYHCQKFMRKYGFEDYFGGPTHAVDFSKIEHLALDPNARD